MNKMAEGDEHLEYLYKSWSRRQTLVTISYRGTAHRNGCLRVGGVNGSAWLSRLQESQVCRTRDNGTE